MSKWNREVTVPDNYDRDPSHRFIHMVDPNDLEQFMNGKRSDVTAVCTKTWAPENVGFRISLPLCPYCFPKRLDRVLAA